MEDIFLVSKNGTRENSYNVMTINQVRDDGGLDQGDASGVVKSGKIQDID